MLIIDANAILRYILYDVKEMAEKVEELISSNIVSVKYEVMAEVVYVLEKNYKLPRDKIVYAIIAFLDLDNVNTEDKDVLIVALKTFETSRFDFVDTLLYAYHVVKGIEIYTFDKKLNAKLNKK